MLENPYFFQKIFEETFPTTYTERGRNECFTTEALTALKL